MRLPQDVRLIFMGTPQFAVPALSAIAKAGYTVVAVYTQPPRPAGRGQGVTLSPIHALGQSLGCPVETPVSLKSPEEQARFAAYRPDVVVVAAYGLILPQGILDVPPWGCINIHGSLLPRWRGASPIQRALMEGDAETGVTIMQMEAGLDSGPIFQMAKIPISADTTAVHLYDSLSQLGAEHIVDVLDRFCQRGEVVSTPQPFHGITFAPKLTHEEGLLDWTLPAETLCRHIRALNPWPGTYTFYGDMRLKILSARWREGALGQQGRAPGAVVSEDFEIACGQGKLQPLTLQKPGSKAMAVQDFMNGMSIPVGAKLC